MSVEIGSIAIGVWVARIVFAVLVIQSLVEGRFRVAIAAAGLAVAGWLLLSRVNPYLITPSLAALDIALVFVVLGRDIRLN